MTAHRGSQASFFFAVGLVMPGACKTGGGEAAPAPIFSEPSLSAPAEEPRPLLVPTTTMPTPTSTPPLGAPAPLAAPTPRALPVPATATALAEALKPVRGGAKVLPPYLGPDPCRMALTGASPVAKACSEGGERRAMDLMQLFVKRARAEGFPFDCHTCHVDEDDRTRLAPNADVEFRKLLFLARPE
jgi:hypothetical protein